MLQVGKIKLRDIKELQEDNSALTAKVQTPLRKRKNAKSATACKKLNNVVVCDKETVIGDAIAATTARTNTSRKRLLKSALKETPSNQKRIDSYFTSCAKNYDIKFTEKEPPTITAAKTKNSRNASASGRKIKSVRRKKARRKRLFSDSTENMSSSNSLKEIKDEPIECITIDSDSEVEKNVKKEAGTSSERQIDSNSCKSSLSLPTTASSLSFGQRMSKTSGANTEGTTKYLTSTSGFSRRKPKPCPPYKVIENTTFAVDAFQFGYIENVSHYFLTHFHADHYIGLTKAFAMPLWMSPITARLLRKFISVEEQYIHELELNQTCIINDIEVTALDANHCPGAILIVFKLPDGKCILHTGDFRACPEMESEPIFWNNNIHTIYLDTTYISEKYAFCTQYESIMKAQDLIEKFLEKHGDKRVLYICGSYLVGKEKFWSSLAEKYDLKVWAEGNRSKALQAINEEHFNRFLVTDPNDANMHVIPMAKLSYLALVEYIKSYEDRYDVVFAIRPSGWEKDTKPRLGNRITVVGVEYSEHSSYMEMQRFVKFLKPKKVISTVPRSRDLMKTSTVPTSWCKYDTLKPSSNYQPTIDSFMSKTPLTNSSIRWPNTNKGGVECFVSPLKSTPSQKLNENLNQGEIISLNSFQLAAAPKEADEIGKSNAKECFTQNSTLNLRNRKAKAGTKNATKARSTTNSSEYFEKSDFIVKTNKKNVEENTKTNKAKQIKPKCNKKQLMPKNSDSKPKEEMLNKSLEVKKVKRKNKKNIANRENERNDFLSPQYSSGNESKDLESETKVVPACETLDMEIPNSQKRITRSGKTLTKSTNSSECQTDYKQSLQYPYDTKLELKPQPNPTTYQNGFSYQSTYNFKIDSATNGAGQASDKSVSQQYSEIPISQKRMTRSKTASSKTTTRSGETQNKIENGFEMESLKLSEQSYKVINSKATLKCAANTSQENPIFKSTTSSIIDSASCDERHMKSVKYKELKSHSSVSSAAWLDQFEYPTTSMASKRPALNDCMTPYKKAKDILDTQVILSSIIKETEDIYQLNCSQLAGLVVETLNERNPDRSKNHIPPELLSDADDDWI